MNCVIIQIIQMYYSDVLLEKKTCWVCFCVTAVVNQLIS